MPTQQPQQPSPTINRPPSRPEEPRKSKLAAVSTTETWQAGSTTLARYRRLVGTVARRGLVKILAQVAQNVAARRERERRSASLLQRHASAFVIHRRDFHRRVRAATQLQHWIRRYQWLRRVEVERKAAEWQWQRAIEEAERRDAAARLIQQSYAAYQAQQQRRRAVMGLARWREAHVERLRRACRVLLTTRRRRVAEKNTQATMQVESEPASDRLTESSPPLSLPACLPRQTDRSDESLLECNDRECDHAADSWSSSAIPDELPPEPSKPVDWMCRASKPVVQELQLAADIIETTLVESSYEVEGAILSSRGMAVIDHKDVTLLDCRSSPSQAIPSVTEAHHTVAVGPRVALRNHVTGMDEETSRSDNDASTLSALAVTDSIILECIDNVCDPPVCASSDPSLSPPTPVTASITPISGSVEVRPCKTTIDAAGDPPAPGAVYAQRTAALSVIERFLQPVVSRRRLLRVAAVTRVQRAARTFLGRQRERAALLAEVFELRGELAQAWSRSFSLDVPGAPDRPTVRRSEARHLGDSDGGSDTEDSDDGGADPGRWRAAETLDCAFLPTRDGFLPPGVRLAGAHGARSGGHADGRGLMSLWWWHWPSETWEAAMPKR